MKIQSALSLAILTAACSQVHAAALDRTGQSIAAFLEDGNYFEASIAAVEADISGQARPQFMTPSTDSSTGNLTNSSTFYNAAIKLQMTPQFSFGLIYDQPFGADTAYKALPNHTFSTDSGLASANVDTQNLSFLFGYQPNENWNFYAAPVYETIKGNVKLNGLAFEAISGYQLNVKENSEIGWLAGMAYQIPEIALKAAVTYRSEIKHSLTADESFAMPLSALVPMIGTGLTNITTPQSINLDLQSGITPTMLVFLNTRWVNWKKFEIKPYAFNKVTEIATGYPNGLILADYNKDQISADLGLAKKINDQWSGVMSAGWDSGAGDPTSVFGPIGGYWSAGVGLRFNPAADYFIQAGLRYFWLEDATGHSAAYALPGNAENAKVADYSDNTALGYLLKIGYKF
ncbi:hypothetical protein [Acinetobacter pragensis]|uniref:Transporter n=1 Tax=Acinetobacter pragensis TaxID=1806892 RepID=A0A151Y418_9GAMM|nr:hypothetical protein [Acinetobacter pragensis]KYQ72773.1 hypothetical protein AZH43_07915 [Acinetobacter pragensis]